MRRELQIGFTALVVGAAVWTAASAAHADQITVEMDKAHTLRLAGSAATVIVGNPLIADAAIQDRRTLVVTGKSYGLTNLIVLNANGSTIFSVDLSVTEPAAPQTSLVSLHRGAERFSYACAGGGGCQSQPMMGDSAQAYQTLSDQRAAKLAASHAEANAE